MEVGIHNITIAISVLHSTETAVPAAVYDVLMVPSPPPSAGSSPAANPAPPSPKPAEGQWRRDLIDPHRNR